jgi:4-hydroxy-3-methylbut-2-en-1-yl diphosphate reductase
MNIHRATHLGMCFGVRDAIELALDRAAREPVTILGDLVHNPTVLGRLRRNGIQIEADPGRVNTASVMITAHGASERRIGALQARGFRVTEATCPLVRVAHRALNSLVAAGFHPVVVGLRGHVEVRGMTEDLEAFEVVLNETEVDALAERPRFGVIAQTTQPIARVRELVARLRRRFPRSEIRFVDTVCQPTKQRQHAAEELAQRCQAIVVVGGAHSNNTRQLAETCRRHGARVYRVETAADLDAAWFAGVSDVGLTAGTSTPDETIATVEARLREIGAGLASGERRAGGPAEGSRSGSAVPAAMAMSHS